MNNTPRKNFVLYIAKISRIFETFLDKICSKGKTTRMKMINISMEKIPTTLVIIKNAYDLFDAEENMTVVVHNNSYNSGHTFDIPSILDFLNNTLSR